VVNERGQAISYLLERVSALSEQVKGFIDDNPNLNHVLEKLRTISDVLRERKFDLMETLSTVAKFVASLGEAVSSGPFFKVLLANLLPYQILQPFVDAAFKQRGIDPEEFWRNAGLPAWRFPDPNGQRFPNGAPAPGPTVLEGTPEYPGPGVLKGSPCSYTPPVDGLPRPGNPLPCADLTTGPFGGPTYGPPDVVTSNPNPNGPGFTPGVPAAAIPGQMPPDMPGVPAPIAPGPPGARTVPVGPLPPQPPDFTPGIAPLPPALTGPPPPPGPGPEVAPAGTPPLPGNPPYLPPGSQER
jgi:phospholipid/cholesterol/gamma-HCH transport system substrate-binding protein